ncbi:MAG: hydantoinase B/oxoprolinase family protein [Proteobacteria bacterium]|nr:hydantoinase B/oxoprolinase family protein [Pseudomonadota bacterium]
MSERHAEGAFDPVMLEVLWTRLISVVDEASAALLRTSFSTLVYESLDFSCVICDEDGNSLVQGTGSIPSFIGTVPRSVKHFIADIGKENMRPGDVLILNDPWKGTGHLPDITVCRPIFREGRIVAFSGSTAHAPDIGGHLRSALPREVFEEGFFMPPMKFIHEGKPDDTFFKLLRAAVRTPDETVGDLWAQVTAHELMAKRLIEVMAEYGLASLKELAAEIQGRCERAMRAAIRAVPDGTYHAEAAMDGSGSPITLKLALTISGDEVICDYAGSSPAQGNAVNAPLCYTFAYTSYALKCVFSPSLPNNEGVFRAVRVMAPEGSILNPRFPTAVGLRAMVGHYLPPMVLSALADVAPHRVMAGPGSPIWNITQSGVRPNGKTYANTMFFNGGMGALASRDGEQCLCWPSNASSSPVEVCEQVSPFFFHFKRLTPDSGGRGRHRGGLGQDVLVESESDTPVTVVFLAERTRNPAPGIKGGGPGGLGAVHINGEWKDAKGKYFLKKGDTLQLTLPGGGGFGPEAERDPGLVARDRLMGYVTR